MAGDPEIHRRGVMFVLSSPSGAGKTTICKRLLAQDDALTLSVSATTRAPRPGEQEGVDYFFKTEDEFLDLERNGGMLEHARVFGNLYGTPRAPVEEALQGGHDVLFDIDWQGTQQLAERAREDLVSVFILPPSVADLEQRLRDRGQDDAETIKKRMNEAFQEMSHWAEYDYAVVNRDLEESVGAVSAILRAERLRRPRQTGLAEFVNAMRGAD